MNNKIKYPRTPHPAIKFNLHIYNNKYKTFILVFQFIVGL